MLSANMFDLSGLEAGRRRSPGGCSLGAPSSTIRTVGSIEVQVLFLLEARVRLGCNIRASCLFLNQQSRSDLPEPLSLAARTI